jgi:hypothetical protein
VQNHFVLKQQIEHTQGSTMNTLLKVCNASLLNKKIKALDTNWEQQLELSLHHRILRVVENELTKQAIDVPPSILDQFKANNKKSVLKMLSFTAELSQICSGLKQRKIQSIALKGPVAAYQIYGDFTAKHSRDIDILIEENHLEPTIEWLKKMGYQPTMSYEGYSEKQKKYFRKTGNQLTLFHQQKRIQVEVHWRLFANPYFLPLSFSKLLKESEEIKIGNVKVHGLSKEHLFFYLCAHGSKHRWSLLYWLHELATFIQKESFEWNSVLSDAIKLGIERPVVQGVMLTELLFNMEAPQEIRAYYLSQPKIQDLGRTVVSTINAGNSDWKNKSTGNYWRILQYKWKLKSNWSYKLAYISGVSTNDFELAKLPDALFFCYFWFRPVFWVWRYLITPKKN